MFFFSTQYLLLTLLTMLTEKSYSKSYFLPRMIPKKKLSQLLFYLTLFLCCRMLIVLSFVYDILPLTFHDKWVFFYGGDFVRYFDMALSFSEFDFSGGMYPVGYPSFLTPFVWIFKATQWQEIVVPVAIFQSIALGGLSIFLVGIIAFTVTKDMRISISAAGLWCFFPVITYYFFSLCKSTDLLRGINIPSLLWVRMYSEPRSTFLILLSTFFVLRYANIFVLSSLAAFCAGAAFLVREDGAVFILIISFFILFRYIVKQVKLSAIIGFFSIIAIVCSIQLLHNYFLTGNIFISGHYEVSIQYCKLAGLKEWSLNNVIFLSQYS